MHMPTAATEGSATTHQQFNMPDAERRQSCETLANILHNSNKVLQTDKGKKYHNTLVGMYENYVGGQLQVGVRQLKLQMRTCSFNLIEAVKHQFTATSNAFSGSLTTCT